MNPEKEKWAEEVIASVDNIQRAKVSAAFYQKTMDRLKAEAIISTGYVLRIAAGLFLLITLNVFACVSFSKENNQSLQAFAKEYGIFSTTDTF